MKVELREGLQAAVVLQVDDGHHCAPNHGRLWGDFNDDDQLSSFYAFSIIMT